MPTARERIMAETSTPPVAVSTAMLRDSLRDFPRYNELVRQELSEGELADEILNAIADFNMLPPMPRSYGPEDFPDRVLLLDMSLCRCLRRLYMWHARNQFSASDAGLQVPIHEQWQPLMQIERTMKAEANERAARLKTMINIQEGFGRGVFSPLWWGGQ